MTLYAFHITYFSLPYANLIISCALVAFCENSVVCFCHIIFCIESLFLVFLLIFPKLSSILDCTIYHLEWGRNLVRRPKTQQCFLEIMQYWYRHPLGVSIMLFIVYVHWNLNRRALKPSTLPACTFAEFEFDSLHEVACFSMISVGLQEEMTERMYWYLKTMPKLYWSAIVQ